MIYPHKCDKCGYSADVYAPASESGAVYDCPECFTVMRRIFTAPGLNCTGYSSDHRINPHTGAEEVCIGNDTEALKKRCAAAKKAQSEYDIPREIKSKLCEALS